jgi:GAF domain-containing protein
MGSTHPTITPLAALAELGRRALAGDDIDGFLEAEAALVSRALDVELCAVFEDSAWEDEPLLRAGTWRDGGPLESPHLLIVGGVDRGICAAIPGEPVPFGTLATYARGDRTFDADDALFLEAAATLIGSAIGARRQRHSAE